MAARRLIAALLYKIGQLFNRAAQLVCPEYFASGGEGTVEIDP